MRCLLAFLLAIPLIAQFSQAPRIPGARTTITTPRTSSANNDPRTLYDQSDAIVVAKTIGGTASPDGTAIAFDVRVQARRVLKGDDVTPGQELHLVFRDDHPRFPISGATPVEPSFGIAFLKRHGDTFEPLRIPVFPAPSGGFLLHLPETSAPTGTVSTLDMRIGLELAAALEYWGVNDATALDEAGGERGLWSPRKASVKAVYFEQAASFFLGPINDPAPFVDLYPQFLRSSSAHVRLVGVVGFIRLQRPEGLEALANDLSLYLNCVGAPLVHQSLRYWDISKYPASVDTLGRIALSEQASANIESAASWALGQHVLVDALPFLIELFESPHPNSRAGALMGVCNLNRGGDPRASLKDYSGEEARPHCPNRLPVTDPDAERAHLAFWRNWWDTNRDRIERDFRQDGTGRITPFARATAPARWVDAARPATRMRSATPEQAVRSILRFFDPEVLSRSATQVPDIDRARGMLRLEADDADLGALVEELKRGAFALHAVDEEFRAAMMQQRLSGQPPDPAIAEQAESRSATVIREFLRVAEQRLSPDAWRSFQSYIQDRAKSMVTISVPTPRPQP